MAPEPSRTVEVTVISFLTKLQPRKIVFDGKTFKELKQRLAAVALPGFGQASDSFVEVLVGDQYLCLLDEEKLPDGDLNVAVHNYTEGMKWEKYQGSSGPQVGGGGPMPFNPMAIPFDLSYRSHGFGGLERGHGPPGGPPHPWHGPPPPHGPHHFEGPHHHEHGPDHSHGPHHRGHSKGRKGDKACSRHRRHRHSSRERSRSPSPSSHRHHGRHRHGRHGHRSKSRSASSAPSHSPPRRGGVNVHVHHHGPRFHGRGMHPHPHHHPRMHGHGHGGFDRRHSGEVDLAVADQGGQEHGEGCDWQEVSETNVAAKELMKLAV